MDYISFLLLLLLLLLPLAIAHSFLPLITRNISSSQWKIFFTRQARAWRGFWIRVSADGAILQETRHIRSFRPLPGLPEGSEEVLQTNSYANPKWPSDGVTTKQWKHFNGSPPRWGVRLYPNGTLAADPLPGLVQFYPKPWALWLGSSSISGTGFVFFEKFFIHPYDAGIRLSIAGVYPSGALARVSYARETEDLDEYPGRYWTDSKSTQVLTETAPSIPGLWVGRRDCLEPGLSYSRRFLVSANGIRRLPVREGCANLQLPDGLAISYPRMVGPSVLGKHTDFETLWIVDRRTVIRSTMTFGEDGEFVRDCTTTFAKLN